ncbi:ParE Plasmid stabilization system protein [Oxalobacteraceae bacterium]
MVKIVYAQQAVDDFLRLTDFLIESNPTAALATVELIEEAIMLLERHPLIGRLVDDVLRELIISRGKSGYVALYSYEQSSDTILILAIRHQREVGMSDSLDNQ